MKLNDTFIANGIEWRVVFIDEQLKMAHAEAKISQAPETCTCPSNELMGRGHRPNCRRPK